MHSNKVVISSDGLFGGIQLHTSGEYTITNSNIPEGWEIHQNNNIILIIDMLAKSSNFAERREGTFQKARVFSGAQPRATGCRPGAMAPISYHM